MKKPAWHKIRKQLEATGSLPDLPDSTGFWQEFRARARLHPQHEPASAPTLPIFYRWAIAGACAILLVSLLGYVFLPGTAGAEPTEIISLQVDAPHSAVLIMNDEPSQATILWIVDMEPENGDGG